MPTALFEQFLSCLMLERACKLGIDIEYSQPVDYWTGMALSDFDHARLIEIYVDHAFKVRDTARTLRRSPHTVTRHIENHRLEVLREGSCARCRRVNGREVLNVLNKTPREESRARSRDLVDL